MKKKETDFQTKVNGYFINELTRGFLGERGQGAWMLGYMGLPQDTVPFSAAVFLQKRQIQWQDSGGNTATIAFRLKPDLIECSGSYMGQSKTIRLRREWDPYESVDMARRVESEAIGDLCMKCIYEIIKPNK